MTVIRATAHRFYKDDSAAYGALDAVIRSFGLPSPQRRRTLRGQAYDEYAVRSHGHQRVFMTVDRPNRHSARHSRPALKIWLNRAGHTDWWITLRFFRTNRWIVVMDRGGGSQVIHIKSNTKARLGLGDAAVIQHQHGLDMARVLVSNYYRSDTVFNP